MNIDALKKELKSFSKQKLIEEYKDLYLAHDMLKQTSIALNKQLDQANERLKEIDNFKYNYGYTNYEDNYMLEDLQSRAFQREDDTAVIESLLDFFDIYDENEILPKVEEMNEKLKCAIVPKFKIGQEVFIVNTDYYYKKDYKVEKHKIVGIEDKIDRKNTYVRWYSLEFKDCPANYSKRYKFLEKNVFTTENKAEKKLQELRGGE